MPSPGNIFVGLTYGQALEAVAARWGEREALVCGGRRFSFAQVKQHVGAAAARLDTLGLRPGGKVALWLPNRAEFLWYWLGAAEMGLVAVVLNTRLTMAECAYQLAQSGAAALILPGPGGFRDFLGEFMRHRAAEAKAELSALEHVLCLDALSAPMHGVTDWSRPLDLDASPPPHATDPDAVALISYSSGTTALPKGATITHCVWRKAYDIGERIDLTEQDRLYLAIPLFGSMAMMNGVLPFWARGAAVIVADRFEAERCIADCLAERCTVIHLLPMMVDELAASPNLAAFRGHRLRVGMTLSNDARKLALVAETLGVPGVITGYGMTETTTVLTRNRWDDPLELRLSTQGRPLPDVEIRLVDVDGGEPPLGEPGEIWARGYCITPGYYNKPAETRAAITPDGWFRTGDLGAFDATGRLAFRGRLGDSYKSRGFNVSAAEVEAALLAHPEIAEAAVIGAPHPVYDSAGAAFVVLRAPVEADEIRAFLRTRLASFKLPEWIFALDSLPLTPGTGKIQKFKLKAQALALLDAANTSS